MHPSVIFSAQVYIGRQCMASSMRAYWQKILTSNFSVSTHPATVIATYSRRMRLRLADRSEVDARIRGKKLKPVCGDRVVASPIADEKEWLISEIQPRTNELSRPNMRGRIEILAANVELLIVVAAATPKPDWFIVDRYLCAAENMRAAAAILFNKSDLEFPAGSREALATYADIGYPTLTCSAETGANIDELVALLGEQIGIIVGQSGVGKSSIINALSKQSNLKTSEISSKHLEGRHTTVNSIMISLPSGGAIIDSPGVRDFAPALNSVADVVTGFVDIREAGRHCRFANCAHLREPGCAVKKSVDEGSLDPRRYESYRRTVALTERLTRDRY